MDRSRLHNVGLAIRRGVVSVAQAFAAKCGAEEAVTLAALALIVAGLWPMLGVRSLVVPGVIILWIALPTRLPFIHRRPDATNRPSASAVRRR